MLISTKKLNENSLWQIMQIVISEFEVFILTKAIVKRFAIVTFLGSNELFQAREYVNDYLFYLN